MKIKLLILFVFSSFYYSQGLIRDPNINDLLRLEYKSIKYLDVKEELFYSPYIEKNKSSDYFNIISKLKYDNYFKIEPVVAVRYSSIGFKMYSDNSDLSLSSVVWITPGIKINSTIPLFKGFSDFWIYSWIDFTPCDTDIWVLFIIF